MPAPVARQPAFDPYAVLGVPREASRLQVARAHRRLAKRFHPDLHPAEDVSLRMRRINEAWHILSSPVRRAAYDLDHPAAGTPLSGHWAASRHDIRPAAPTTAGTWASWRASAEATAAAPRTRRQPGEVRVTPTRRPERMVPSTPAFRDSGWAAFIAAVTVLLILGAAIIAGRLA